MAHGINVIQGFEAPAGYVQIATVTTATGLSSIPNHSKMVMIQAESQNVRWRDDGVDPTASVGMLLVANDVLMYTGNFSAIKFIEATVGAKLNISYYK